MVNDVVEAILYYDLFNLMSSPHLGTLFMYIVLPGAIYKLNKETTDSYRGFKSHHYDFIYQTLHFLNKHRVKIITFTIILFCCFVRQTLLIQVTEPVTNIYGLKQRAEIFEKLVSFEDNIKTAEHNIGSAVNLAIYWPSAPSQQELKMLREYLDMFFSHFDTMVKENKICSDTYKQREHYKIRTTNDKYKLFQDINTRTDHVEGIKIIKPVNNIIKKIDPHIISNSDTLITLALQNIYKCKDIHSINGKQK